MDSTLLTVLIPLPVSLFAAMTAYGAGRVQGRGAVDSVRRASQRDSYAQFLTACYAFGEQALRTWPADDERPAFSEAEALNTLAKKIGERVSFVTLDGPPSVARAAHEVWERASHIALDAQLNQPGLRRAVHYDAGLTAFVVEASAHLNTGLLPRRRRR